MPGCIIDIYNDVAVLQFHSLGMWLLKVFSRIIEEIIPEINIIYDKSEGTLPKQHKAEYKVINDYLLRKTPKVNTVVHEYGNAFIIDWVNGKKLASL